MGKSLFGNAPGKRGMDMNTIHEDSLAKIRFKLKWQSSAVRHTDILFAENVNFWRDIFPEDVRRSIMGKQPGSRMEFFFAPGELLPLPDSRQRFCIDHRQFDRRRVNGHRIEPHFGRFYPKGLVKGMPNIFSGNMEPFRCTGVDAAQLEIDFNHPLAGKELALNIAIHDVKVKRSDKGGRLTHWIESITDGPGMQARVDGKPTDFFSGQAFFRADEQDDIVFYEKPRLVTHIDDRAGEIIAALYGRLLEPEMHVLDLMSSWRSHIPESLRLSSLVGLGLNAEEMKNNPQLDTHLTHDLNKNPRLPFDDHTFDAVICSVSVEYMVKPFDLFQDVSRILKPGGLFVNTFSNRWFPPKAVKVWQELSELERTGMVLEYYLSSGAYENLETYSSRGWPRPTSDRYYPGIMTADPVYAVWGRTKRQVVI